jgi:AcrR family transcriptional regulator
MASDDQIPARTRSRRGEGEQLREALLDAATALLGELRDVEKLSVRGVTGRAGVSPAALYLHFEDKAALTLAVKDRGFERLLVALERARAAAPPGAAQALIAMGEAYLAFADDQPALYAVLFMTHIPRRGAPVLRDAAGHGPGERVFHAVAEAVGRALRTDGRIASDAVVFHEATVVWMALHGRATVARAMPSFGFAEPRAFMQVLLGRAADLPASAPPALPDPGAPSVSTPAESSR